MAGSSTIVSCCIAATEQIFNLNHQKQYLPEKLQAK
jgi:hypothetical protein